MSDAGYPSSADFASAPACVPGSCVIAWSLDGTSGTKTYPLAHFAFGNGTAFDTDFGTGGHVYMNMAAAGTEGQVMGSAGTLRTPSEGPLPGTDLCLGDGSRLEFFHEGGFQVLFLGRCVTEACMAANPQPRGGSVVGCCSQ